jgi:hypothetical protein
MQDDVILRGTLDQDPEHLWYLPIPQILISSTFLGRSIYEHVSSGSNGVLSKNDRFTAL